MTLNKSNMGLGKKDPNLLTATELDVIASAIVTLGDGLETIAAVLALEEERSLENQDMQLKSMQKQIDYLTNELSKIKSQMT